MTDKQRQYLLGFLGYYVGVPDDIWGSLSKEACRRFQQDYGIRDDGYGGPETDTALLDAVVKGMPGKDITVPSKTGTFWDEIEYFSREEFRCQCGGKYCNGFPAEPDETLVRLVNDIRKKAGRPAHRSSGLRCRTWNAMQGGVFNSKHMSGKALDFYVEGVSGSDLLAMAQNDPRTNYAYQIDGPYVHVDVG